MQFKNKNIRSDMQFIMNKKMGVTMKAIIILIEN
jgi:hypothetical protein